MPSKTCEHCGDEFNPINAPDQYAAEYCRDCRNDPDVGPEFDGSTAEDVDVLGDN